MAELISGRLAVQLALEHLRLRLAAGKALIPPRLLEVLKDRIFSGLARP